MVKYIPTSISYVVTKSIEIEGEIYPVVTPFCSRFKKNIKARLSNIVDSNQVIFNNIKAVQIGSNKIAALINTDVGKAILSQELISSGEIAVEILNNGIGEDNTLKFEAGLYSKLPGRGLRLERTNSEKWKELSEQDPLREKSFKPSELKIGHVYSQLLIDKNSFLLYLGRVKDPSRDGKLSFVFIETEESPYSEPNTGYINSITDSLVNFFHFEEQDQTKWKSRSRIYNRIQIKQSIPINLIIDNGAFDIANISVNGKSFTVDNIQKIIQDEVDKQWIEYLQIVEHRKVLGKFIERRSGSNTFKHFVWDIPEPPSWLDWYRRIK